MSKMSNKARQELANKIVADMLQEIDQGTIRWAETIFGTIEEQMKMAGVIVGRDEIDLD